MEVSAGQQGLPNANLLLRFPNTARPSKLGKWGKVWGAVGAVGAFGAVGALSGAICKCGCLGKAECATCLIIYLFILCLYIVKSNPHPN